MTRGHTTIVYMNTADDIYIITQITRSFWISIKRFSSIVTVRCTRLLAQCHYMDCVLETYIMLKYVSSDKIPIGFVELYTDL